MSNVQRTDTTPNPGSSNPLQTPSKDDKVNSDETPADDPGSNIIYTMSRHQTDTTARPDGSVPSQTSPQAHPPDDNVNGGKAPVGDSGGRDTEHPNNSKDDDKTETRDLDHILEKAEKEMTKDMGFK